MAARVSCVVKKTVVVIFGITIFEKIETIDVGQPDIMVDVDENYFRNEFQLGGDD